MTFLEAIILGIIQGLTEFLPVSSSGHLEIGKHLFGIDAISSFSFSVAVHGATVLSTLVVFRQEVLKLIKGTLQFRMNSETHYVLKILVSMIPVAVTGLFFEKEIESFFEGNIVFVGFMLIVTAALLIGSHFMKDRRREISYFHAFIIGIAQALAVLPGISRSGATISAGLMLGNKKENLARFSFLMVLIPVIEANLLKLFEGDFSAANSVGPAALIAGFVAAFLTGYMACRWMVNLVKRGKLYWFGIYCILAGLTAIIIG
ncbi:MAG: undecaprenyl-diphosphate phosphatase [Bacteroidales bacterium]|jgi:undecaprenyl-diphosphatase|nr:undecaprenyl-diphosphate phosphatase [Bacteroidales bacterium]